MYITHYIFIACAVLWRITVRTKCWCDCIGDALDKSLEANTYHRQGNIDRNRTYVM